MPPHPPPPLFPSPPYAAAFFFLLPLPYRPLPSPVAFPPPPPPPSSLIPSITSPSSLQSIKNNETISNALMVALKRAQVHQRHGCSEQQQNPLLVVKVELEQLVISSSPSSSAVAVDDDDADGGGDGGGGGGTTDDDDVDGVGGARARRWQGRGTAMLVVGDGGRGREMRLPKDMGR